MSRLADEITVNLWQDIARAHLARAAELAAALKDEPEPDSEGAAPAPADRLITAADAAPMLGIGESTLYRKADDYPFTRRGPAGLRFSLRGIREWIAGRPPTAA